MAKAKAPSTTAACPGPLCFTNPLNWAPTNPKPVGTSTQPAWPIGGFTFIDTYTCVASSSTLNALVNAKAPYGLFKWYNGTKTSAGVNHCDPTSVLQARGFAPLPGAWQGAVGKLLLTNAPTKISLGGSGTACAGKTGL